MNNKYRVVVDLDMICHTIMSVDVVASCNNIAKAKGMLEIKNASEYSLITLFGGTITCERILNE